MGYNQSFLYPKSGGIETFTRALQTRMAAAAACTPASSPDAVDWRRREVTVGGERIHYRALVATIPLPELLQADDRAAARDRDARPRACAARRCAT